MSLSAYELERLENIRRNEEQLEQLGLGGGVVPPKAKRQKRAAPSTPPPTEPLRRSSRVLHESADIAGRNVAAAKTTTGKNDGDVVIVEAEIDSGDDEAGPSEMVLSSVVVEAEGYRLFLSKTSATGYMGVREQNGRFQARRKVDGKYVHIGVYDTAVEAAVAYAKHAAGEEVVRPVPAAAMEVEVKEAEGYQLFVSKTSATGYMGVVERNGRFQAKRKVDGKYVHIGVYDTAVEAAVAYAKHAAGEEVVRPVPAAAVEVEVKEAEGYQLFLSTRSDNKTGYKGVHEHDGRFQARRSVGDKMVHIGYYDTAVEAAVAYAKHAAGEEVVRPVPAAAMEVEVKEVEVKEAEGYKLHLALREQT